MKSVWKYLFSISLILALGAAPLWGQGTAQVSGTVADPTGALLPGVEVTATHTATGLVRTVISNETGFYTIPNLPTGPYRLEVSLPGFRTSVRTGIVLEVNSNPVINVTLEVGQVTETIEVSAAAALVETRNVGVGQLMEAERILELPLNGRNVTELITLAGAAVQTGTSSGRSMPNQQAISVAGGLSSGVGYSLDGAIHNNPYDNLSLPLPFPDALGEFSVQTSALAASQGFHSGAQVSAVTRSGTNELHGNAFYFLRNDLFNAREYFSETNSTLKRNQFGGTLGGPIVRNEMFFFGGYQGTIIRQDPANRESWVPTPAMLRGDFSRFSSEACGNPLPLRDPETGQPFPNNQIDPARFSPAALNVASRLPSPQDECGFIRWGVINQDSDFQAVGKVDWQLNPDHSLMGRVLFTGDTRPAPHTVTPNNLLTVCCADRDNLAQSYALGHTWLVNPNTVMSNRLVANYTNIQRKGIEFMNLSEMGVKNFFSYLPEYAVVTVSDPGFSLGAGTQNRATYRTFSTGVNSDLSLARGSHQWSLGGAALWIDSNSNANVWSQGNFSFNGNRTGLGMADFLLGLPNQLQQAAPNVAYARKWYLGGYLTDTWRVASKLTLNYGVRWEPDLAETLTLGQVTTYSEERRVQGIRSTQFVNAPLGFYFPGDPGFPGKRGRDRNWWTFAPRFGFAYDVFGDGRTSVRGSVGIGYEAPNMQFHLWTSIVPPWGGATTVINPSFDDPWANVPGGNPFPIVLSSTANFVPFGGFTTMSNIDPAQQQSWNLAVQRQLGEDWLVSASYVGSHTIHIIDSAPLNPAIYFPGNANANGECFGTGYFGEHYTFRTNPGAVCSTNGNVNQRRRLSLVDFQNTGRFVGAVAEIQSGGNASYNGLLLEVRKRAARGVTLSGNYTWSHCIGPFHANEAGETGANPALAWPVPQDRDRLRGNCPSDRRHMTNLTAVAEMPQLANPRLRMIASGWRLSAIYRYATGSFLTVTNGGGPNLDRARSGTNTGNQPATYVGGDPIGDPSGRPNTRWLNRSAFAVPALGTFGNVGTRSIQGPSQWDFDLALSRVFQVTEGHRLEARAEMYNVTNSFRPMDPATALSSPFFGQLRESRSPRIMQFALKYVF